jgi:hypothetical protein
MRVLLKAIFILGLFVSCKKEFEPDTIAGKRNLLVVEGFINTGWGPTTIKLTRTTDLKDFKRLAPETGAILSVEGENGFDIKGESDEKGICTIATGSLDRTKRYRLRIRTQNGKEYLSDFLENRSSPELNVELGTEEDGVRLYAETEDLTKATQYFSWEYEETWEFHSKFESRFQVVNGQIEERDPSINITRCWKTDKSKQILIASTENLSASKVTQFSLVFLNSLSEKVQVKYKIKVIQHGITKQGYKYLSRMKKSTEEIGTIFDPQPTEIKGNIRCITDPNESVVGYINAGKPSERVLYITREMMPQAGPSAKTICEEIRDLGSFDAISYTTNKYLITSGVPFLGIYHVAPAVCVDCTLSGSNIEPDQWPQ